MTTHDDSLNSTIDKMLSVHCTADRVREAQSSVWSDELWQVISAAELPWISIAEESGGPGGSLLDAAVMLKAAGRHALPLPVGETSLISGWLLHQAGIQLPTEPITSPVPHAYDSARLVRRDGGWELSCHFHRVPWAQAAKRLVALVDSDEGPQIVSVALSDSYVTPDRGLSGEPRDEVHIAGFVPTDPDVAKAPPGVTAQAVLERGALSRVLLMAGAMERALELTSSYAQTRKQFGRSISSFQAVQHHVARLGAETVAANLAADTAALALESGDGSFAIASAKSAVSSASSVVAGLAHQVHGAIGMTDEYRLQQFTRRLWVWRQEYGSSSLWGRTISATIREHSAAGLWSVVSGGQGR